MHTSSIEKDHQTNSPQVTAHQQVIDSKVQQRVGYLGPIAADEAQAALSTLRARAAGWSGGTGVLIGLIVGSLGLRSSTPVDESSLVPRIIVTALIGIAVSLTLLGLHKLLQAAYGPSQLDTRLEELVRPFDAKRILRRLWWARRDLVIGQTAVWLGIGIYMIAITISWFTPAFP